MSDQPTFSIPNQKSSAERRRQARAAALSAASVALALILVVAGAYTAAQESRAIAEAATDIQRIDVVRLRVSELEAARLLAQSGNASTEATAEQLRSNSIGDLTAASESSEIPQTLASALEAYLRTADNDLADPQATALIVEAIDEARESVADELDESSGLLDSLSILLVITITYIVPALGFVVFWLAVRQTRSLQEARAEVRHERQRSSLRDALLQSRLSAIEAVATNAHMSKVAAAVGASIDSTRAMIDAIDETTVAVNTDVSIAELLSEVHDEHRTVSGAEVQTASGFDEVRRAIVHADRQLVGRALSLVAANARRRGCKRLHVQGRRTETGIALSFSHDGAPLTEAEVRLVLDQVPLNGEAALERGSELLLLAYAARLLEHCQAGLDIERADGLERVVVTLTAAAPSLASPRSQAPETATAA